MKQPGMDPHVRQLLTLAVLAAFGCGLALAQGHFLFVGIFAAASSNDYRSDTTFAMRIIGPRTKRK
jgi:hypothetical protein